MTALDGLRNEMRTPAYTLEHQLGYVNLSKRYFLLQLASRKEAREALRILGTQRRGFVCSTLNFSGQLWPSSVVFARLNIPTTPQFVLIQFSVFWKVVCTFPCESIS